MGVELARTAFEDMLPVRDMFWADCAHFITASLMGHFFDYGASVETYLSLVNLALKIEMAYTGDEEAINSLYTGAGVHVFKARGIEGFSLASDYLARGYETYKGNSYQYAIVKFAEVRPALTSILIAHARLQQCDVIPHRTMVHSPVTPHHLPCRSQTMQEGLVRRERLVAVPQDDHAMPAGDSLKWKLRLLSGDSKAALHDRRRRETSVKGAIMLKKAK